MLKRPLAALATLLAVTVLAGCSDDDGDRIASDPAPSAEASTPAGEPTEEPGAESSAPAAAACEYVEDGSPAKEVDLPPAEPTVSGQVPVTVATSVGELAFTLDADAAPCTVNSFVSLAEQGYYDDTNCPRISDTGIFILQCGDPTGTGAGGPGYSFADEVTGSETYGPGTLAMANAGPDTNGSQFFIVYDDSPLDPAYTVFGTVDEASLAILEDVAADGNDGSNPAGGGVPNTPIDISTVTVG